MTNLRGGTARAVDKIIRDFGEREFGSIEIFTQLPNLTRQAVRSHLNWLVANGRLTAHRHATKRVLAYRVQTQQTGLYCSVELIDIMRKLGSCKRKAPKRADPEDTARRVVEILARVRAA